MQTTDNGRRDAPPGGGAWTTGDPAEVGLDGSALDRVAGVLGARGERQGIVEARRGILAFERYWANEYHRAEPAWRNVSFSSGKSWGSTMVGRAIALGLLELDDPVARYHAPAVSGLHPGVTMRHLVTWPTSSLPRRARPATSPSPLNPDYGFLWWLNTSGRIAGAPRSMFYAAGARGQFCFVLPDHDMVIATMGFGRRPLTAPDARAVLREVLPP